MLKIFSVYDAKAEAYLPPMFLQARGLAIRSFSAAVARADHDFSQFAEDYTLFELGEFDEVSAKFKLYDTPVSLGTALEYKAKSQA